MDAMTTFDLLLLSTAALLMAGTIKGLAGLGLPTAAASILTLFVAPRTAIAMILFPMLIANAWQVYRQGDILRAARQYSIFGVALAVVVFLTVIASAEASDRLIFMVLGLSIICFCIANLSMPIPPLPDRLDRWAQIVFGAIAGVLGGLSGIWAAPLAIYLTARQVDKDEFVRVTGLLIFIGSVPLAIGYLGQGFLTPDFALIGLYLVVPTLIGFSLGEWLRSKLSSEKFRLVFLWLFLLLGLNLLRRGVF